ncbi:MAG: ribosomal protein L13e [Thaumarchaeota archaeon]|nr:ribosomal protein L13e [Nitrososphaerota archaeon]
MSSKSQKKTKGRGIKEEVAKAEEKVRKGAVKVEKEIKKETKRATERRPRQVLTRPPGKAPEAVVVARHEAGMVTRAGRGFSFGELSGVGLAPRTAMMWGVRVDHRRRSVLEGNVSSLKTWHSHHGTVAKVETEAKKLGEVLEKAGKEVEKEAAAVEKEAVKVGKKVKREAKKAEEAVKEKVEKPKARPKKDKA